MRTLEESSSQFYTPPRRTRDDSYRSNVAAALASEVSMPTPPMRRRSSGRLTMGWLLGIAVLLFATSPAWSAIATDVIVSTNQSNPASNITSPSFSTASDPELLLAFISSDATSSGMTVTSVAGASLNWVLVRRTNAQLG